MKKNEMEVNNVQGTFSVNREKNYIVEDYNGNEFKELTEMFNEHLDEGEYYEIDIRKYYANDWVDGELKLATDGEEKSLKYESKYVKVEETFELGSTVNFEEFLDKIDEKEQEARYNWFKEHFNEDSVKEELDGVEGEDFRREAFETLVRDYVGLYDYEYCHFYDKLVSDYSEVIF